MGARILAFVAIVLAGACTLTSEPLTRDTRARPADYDSWLAYVVAGDHRATNGAETQAFDNARRDVAVFLERIGLRAKNIRQYSAKWEKFKDANVRPASIEELATGLEAVPLQKAGGCLVYITSHGDPKGITVGEDKLAPEELDRMLKDTCAERPTILVVSACYSGNFVQQGMLAANRFIMTAARSDRSSFGCGESDKYPFFDTCFLAEAKLAKGWLDLAQRVRSCVSRRETQMKLAPPSQPQYAVGEGIFSLIREFPD